MSAEQCMGLHGELVQVKYNGQTGVCAFVCVYAHISFQYLLLQKVYEYLEMQAEMLRYKE